MIHQGRPISPGAARGPAFVINGRLLLDAAIKWSPVGTPQQETERLHSARIQADAQLRSVERQFVAQGNSDDAGIFAAHALLLNDPGLAERITAAIKEQTLSAEAAIAQVTFEIERQFLESNSSMLHDKVTDILDIGQRLIRCLRGMSTAAAIDGGVIVSESLTPSDFVRAVHQGAIAAVTATCGQKSHTAILARGFALPFITGVAAFDQITSGTDLFVDGDTARVVIDPTPEVMSLADSDREHDAKHSVGVPITADGTRMTVLLNISDPSEAEVVAEIGADGVGLYRTEFLYMDRTTWPSEDESFEVYAAVAKAVGDRELNFRLADFGAEKCPPYADIPLSRNPALGIRGIRFLLARADIRTPQVRALARLARQRPLTVLLPMVDTVDNLQAAIECLRRDCKCRREEDLPFRLGTMIEVPSAALQIEEIIEYVDSIAIGLNDLTQYLLAADRDDEMVESHHDALQPAVLRLVRRVIEVADQHDRPVTMCGELAGDPLLSRVLPGLGARRFSISQSHYRATVTRLQSIHLDQQKNVAEQVLLSVSGAAVRSRLSSNTDRA
ncbi:MAG: phosphoenolpyruvate--protein phosphotransferase [Planctomycetota bacterium]|nr:phosphoenolpyruvate--protein phosphotransferase [Planctomycetota bacterium]